MIRFLVLITIGYTIHQNRKDIPGNYVSDMTHNAEMGAINGFRLLTAVNRILIMTAKTCPERRI